MGYTLFRSVKEGDYSENRGAEKLRISLEEFRKQYVKWSDVKK